MDYQLKQPLLPLKNTYSVVERVFAIRGIAPENIEHYLNTTSDDILNPLLLDNMDRGAKMLVRHIAQNDQTLIIVDCDVDGYSSAALLINYLNCLFPAFVQTKVSYRIHSGKQHGLEDQLDYILKHEEYKLIICPDSASNDYIIHEQLVNSGKEILVLDHHDAERQSEYACVINNQLCNYPTKSLSGVAIVWKFCCYLDKVIDQNYAQQFLDLVALGLVGDVMDLRPYETRELVVEGTKEIHNPYIKGMYKAVQTMVDRKGGLNPYTIGFYIAPQINGTIRMGTIEEKLMLFESMLDFKGYEQIPSTKRGCKGQFETRVEQACRNCVNIKRNQSKATETSLKIIERIIEEDNLLENKIIIIKLLSEYNVDRNLTGLIANKIMSDYQHPVLLLSETINEVGEKEWSGSGRGYETADFNDFKSFVKDSQCASLAEGHPLAFGVSIPDKNMDAFIKYSNEALKDYTFTPSTKVDFIWHTYDFTGKDVTDIASLQSVWGQEVAEPMIAIEDIAVTTDRLHIMGKSTTPTVKIELPNGVSLIKFKVTEEEVEQLTPSSSSGSVNINIIGVCKINEWNGIISPQIEIKEYEIVGKTDYYF